MHAYVGITNVPIAMYVHGYMYELHVWICSQGSKKCCYQEMWLFN